MSSNLEFLGAMQTVMLPSRAEDFPLGTTDDLRRAYREYAKYNDDRLIFDTSQLELSPLGQDTLFATIRIPPVPSFEDKDQYWDELFATDELVACNDTSTREIEYWSALDTRIRAFVATELGQVVTAELWCHLEECLLSTLYHEGPIPDTLYERVIAVEVVWRAEMRWRHSQVAPQLYQQARSMNIEILARSGGGDNSKDKTIALAVCASHSFPQFLETLHHYSAFPEIANVDKWYYKNPNCADTNSLDYLKPITATVYDNLKLVQMESRKRKGEQLKLLCVHESQIAFVRGIEDGIVPENVLERDVDEDMRAEIEREWEDAVEMARRDRITKEDRRMTRTLDGDNEIGWGWGTGEEIEGIKQEMGYRSGARVLQRARRVSLDTTSSCSF